MAASTAAQLIQAIVPTLDTSAYADNDVMFNSVEIPRVMFAPGRAAELISITGLDKADQGVDFDLLFSQTALTLGTINAAVDATDAVLLAAGILGHVSILGASGHYIDLINSQAICWRGDPLMLEAATGSQSIFVSGIIRSGTPTYAADSLSLNFGVRRH